MMKQIRIQDFRHSHVALLIDQETGYTNIKERLGHASIVTTSDTYGHFSQLSNAKPPMLPTNSSKGKV
ncbi:hypothetical protein [Lapidilactobacillus luobeiensis]|uniref:hypothetical protein n=1 Tax=Lapidilactobacillus luobeiensis TaxID=2950371 RepID=UPI0021C387AF|nr:hypothetical protein [Lapidilactobacillus luobeiensis]